MGPDIDGAAGNTRESVQQVTVRALAHDTTLFTVTREFEPIVPGKGMALDCAEIAITDGSVITSFAVRTQSDWRQGHLRTYEAAPFEKGAEQRPWASLHWAGGASLPCLEVPAYSATRPLLVRYEIWARAQLTEHHARWIYCDHPDTDDARSSAEFSIYSLSPELTVRRDTDLDSAPCVVVERSLPSPTRLTARYGRYYLGNVWWWRIESAWPVSLAAAQSMQRGPVVFVLDTSRSQLTNNGFTLQLQVVKALVKQLQRAGVEIVLVNRFAQRVFGHFVPAADLDPKALDALANQPLGNGSFLDRGVELAAQVLLNQGKPGRIIVMSDGELRSRFDIAATSYRLRHAPRGTVVHLLQPVAGEADDVESIDPNSEHDSPFMERGANQLSAMFHGTIYTVTIGAKPNGPPTTSLERLLAAALLGDAIKPEAWQHITLRDSTRPGQHEWPTRAGWPYGKPEGYSKSSSGTYYPSYLETLTSPDSEESTASKNVVTAGGRQVWSGFSREPPPAKLILSGQAMGRAIQMDLSADPAFEAQLPRLANSQPEVIRCLSLPHHNRYALAAGFLAPTFEFWVSGTNDSQEVGEITSGSGDDWCESNAMGGWGTAPQVANNPFPNVAALVKPCGLVDNAQGPFKVTIETRKFEILDAIASGPDPTRRACLEEAIWSLPLPIGFHQGLPATYTLGFAAVE